MVIMCLLVTNESDIFHVYITLLKQMKPIYYTANINSDSMDEETPISLLQSQVPMIVKAVHIQLRERSIKTRKECLASLRELVLVIPAVSTAHILLLITGLHDSLG